MRKLFVLFIFICGILAGCNKIKKYEQEEFLFGTLINIKVYSSNKKKAMQAIEAAFLEMRRVDKNLNSHGEKSEINQINKKSGLSVKISPEFQSLLEVNQKAHKLSKRKYDISIKPLVELWGFGEKPQRIPSQAEIDAILQKVGQDKIEIRENRIKLEEGQAIDTGAFLKGYAVERAKQKLIEHDIKSGIISSISSISALDTKPNNKSWRIALQNPLDKSDIIGILEIKNKSVGVSGDYQNYIEIDGKRYHHILDATTGYPVEDIKMLVIIADNALTADLYSTALFTIGAKEAIEKVDKIPGIEGIAVDDDFVIWTSLGAEKYFKEVDVYE